MREIERWSLKIISQARALSFFLVNFLFSPGFLLCNTTDAVFHFPSMIAEGAQLHISSDILHKH